MRNNAITYEEMFGICKAGQGLVCCRYIGADAEGTACLKHDEDFRLAIDARVAKGTMIATGDNCEGKQP